jgi:hypothetical protein
MYVMKVECCWLVPVPALGPGAAWGWSDCWLCQARRREPALLVLQLLMWW